MEGGAGVRLSGKPATLAVGLALLAAVTSQPPSSRAGDAAPGGSSAEVPALPAAIVAAGSHSQGKVVRQAGALTVSEVPLGAVSPSARAGVRPVWRVEVQGQFPPRALRYTVFAGDRPVAYGTPSADERALVSVTGDAAVLSAPVSVRYGDQPAGAVAPALSAAAVASAPASMPPLSRGPLAVQRAVYNLGNQVFQPSHLQGKVELTADVHYPKGLPGGPYPLVLFLHGNHDACYRGTHTSYEWPCTRGFRPLPNYVGYDYIANRLASFGFIVVSVSANGVNVLGNQVRDTGMRQRGELIEKHLDLWHAWSTKGGGPFGSRFVGKVDFTRIGVMGHSRGGEGAVWAVLVDRARAHPYGIKAVLPLAPVDFTRVTVNRVPLEVMLPYCDGDVFDLEGIHFFDDARYRVPGDPAPKGTITVMGADHNFFNTVWSPSSRYPGGFKDTAFGCKAPLGEKQQRRVGSVYIVNDFLRYLGGHTELDPVFTGARIPPAIAPARAVVTYLPPDRPDQRLDVNRFTQRESLTRDTLGGAVTASNMSAALWCPDTQQFDCVPGLFGFNDVHIPALGQGVFGWDTTRGEVSMAVPPGKGNVAALAALQFRVALNPGYVLNDGVAVQDLTVELADASGGTASVAASSVNRAALESPPGTHGFGHFILNQVRFPLRMFTGVDLRHITAVRLRFDRNPSGVIDVSDMAFTRGAG
jgi:hypothetical protein